jgi:hypothetical protein
MNVRLEDVFRQNEETASREIGGLAYVVDSATVELHGFNEVATRVWALLDGIRSVGEIVTIILEEYDVDRYAAETDVLELLEDLSSKRLVILA